MHRLGDRFVAGRDELAGHVAHEQRDTPAVAAPTRGTERGVIDEFGRDVHQPDLPHVARQAPDVAGGSHPEVVIDVDELYDASFAIDLDLLERGGRTDVGRAEVAEPTGAFEQLVDGVGDRTGDEIKGADHRTSMHLSRHGWPPPSRRAAWPASGHHTRRGRRRCGRRRRSGRRSTRGNGGWRAARRPRPTPAGT